MAVGAIIVGWGVGQYPLILPPSLTIAAAAAPEGTIVSLLVISVVAVVLIGPSLGLLFWLQQRSRLETEPAVQPGVVAAGAGSDTGGVSPA
jgi:cytochrome d ubiquinol oxidase subunit II